MSELPCVPKTLPCVSTEVVKEHTLLTKLSVHIPAVPVLWSPPLMTHVTNVMPPVNSVNTLINVASNSSNIAGSVVIITTAATTACTALVNKTPSSWAGTPNILSQPGSAFSQDHPHSVPIMHPPSQAAMLLIPTASPVGEAGLVAPVKQMINPVDQRVQLPVLNY